MKWGWSVGTHVPLLLLEWDFLSVCVLVGWFGLALLGAHQLRDVLLWVIQAV